LQAVVVVADLFIDAVNNSKYIALSGGVMSEQRTGKDVEGAGHFRQCPCTGLETMKKIKKKIPFPDRDLYSRLHDLHFTKNSKLKTNQLKFSQHAEPIV
jgi:hypothetical protein